MDEPTFDVTSLLIELELLRAKVAAQKQILLDVLGDIYPTPGCECAFCKAMREALDE